MGITLLTWIFAIIAVVSLLIAAPSTWGWRYDAIMPWKTKRQLEETKSTPLSHSAKLMLGEESIRFMGNVKEIAERDFTNIERRKKIYQGNSERLDYFIREQTGVTKARTFTSEVLKTINASLDFDINEITDDEWELIIEAYNKEMYRLRKSSMDTAETLDQIENKYRSKQLEWLHRSNSLEQVKKDTEPAGAMQRWDAEFHNS